MTLSGLGTFAKPISSIRGRGGVLGGRERQRDRKTKERKKKNKDEGDPHTLELNPCCSLTVAPEERVWKS